MSDSFKLGSVQAYAARVCLGAMKRTNYSKLCQELRWQTLKTRRLLHQTVLTFKILNNFAPNYLKQNFVPILQNSRNLRRSDRLTYPKCRLNSFAHSFFPLQTKHWNCLPQDIINSESVLVFKSRLYRHFDEFVENFHDQFAYSTCSSYYGQILTQMRLGLSPLHQQLFVYNLVDNPICPSCGKDVETAEHFFLLCNAYFEQRIILVKNMLEIVNHWNILSNSDKTIILVKGLQKNNPNNSSATNILISYASQRFIQASRRFLY